MQQEARRARVITRDEVPPVAEENAIYRFPARALPAGSREERTDRNAPIIFPRLQALIHEQTFAILGSGGIGGHMDDSMARLLPKRIVIVDSGIFDLSNVHRQFAARLDTIGKSKALETARMVREIAPDIEIVACPDGTNPDTVYYILEEATLGIDAIEYHRIGARYEAMQVAEELGLPILNGNSVGFGTHLHFWSHQKDASGRLTHPSFKEAWPFDREFAYRIEDAIAGGTCTEAEYNFCCHAINKLYLPNIPNYGSETYDTRALFLRRLFEKRIACIVSTNPKKAAGFAANHVPIFLAESLGDRNEWKNVPKLAVFPNYVYEDTALRILETRSLDLPKIRYELDQSIPR
jgi:molybdopterin/thiamine biosynthesis adenylyltransferase